MLHSGFGQINVKRRMASPGSSWLHTMIHAIIDEISETRRKRTMKPNATPRARFPGTTIKADKKYSNET